MLEQLSVGELQVDVPFLLEQLRRVCGVGVAIYLLLCERRHVEGCLFESGVHLVAHFEVLPGYARSYNGFQLLRVGLVGDAHVGYRLAHDACQRTAPSGVNGCRCVVLLVVEQYGYAVGCRHSDAYALYVGEQRVDAFELHLAYLLGQGAELLAYDACLGAVCLVGQYDAVGVYAQLLSQQRAVGSHVLGLVAAVGVDVQRGVVALAGSAVACG